MTQEDYEDFYGMEKEGIISNGCCLLCNSRYDGCLCFDCNCSKCYWLIPAEEWNGEKGRCQLALNKKKIKKDGNTNT